MRTRIIDAQQAARDSDEVKRWHTDLAVTKETVPWGLSGTATVFSSGGRLLIPTAARDLITELLRAAHEDAGHYDGERTYRNLRQAGVLWRGMAAECSRHAGKCSLCQRARAPQDRPKKVGLLGDRPTPSVPLQAVNIDYAGPFNVNKSRAYVLAIVDMFTRYTTLIAISSQDAASTIAGLQQFFGIFGVPSHIYCDGGSHFKNKQLQTFAARHGVAMHYSTPYNPESNGIVERKMAPLVHYLTTTLFPFYEKWTDHLSDAQLALNATYSRVLGMSPYEALFGFTPRTALAVSVGVDHCEELDGTLLAHHAQLEAARDRAHARVEHSRTLEKARYDAVTRRVTYAAGDVVMLYGGQAVVKDGKFGSTWVGPYIVQSVAPGNGETYVCKEVITGAIRQAHVRAMLRLSKERFTLEEEWARFNIYVVKDILAHKVVDGAYQFLVQFKGVDTPVWQSPVGDSGTGIRSTVPFQDYVRTRSIDLRVPPPPPSPPA